MSEINDYLASIKTDLDNIEVPEELEARLRSSLSKATSKPKLKKAHGLVASILVLLLLIASYNYSAIAYYSRKILGFDQVVYGTLGDLNEQGHGQVIGESYTFQNGVKVTLDGVMIDHNQMVAFYTITDESGNSTYDLDLTSFKGFWGNYNHVHGHGLINDEETEVKWISIYDAPKALDRTLTFNFSLFSRGDTPWERGEISFKLDRSKALGHTIKQSINQTVMVEDSKVHFDAIIASPTVTKVLGTFNTPLESIVRRKNGEVYTPDLEIILVIDGKRQTSTVRQIGSSLKGGYTFEFHFEGLTGPVKNLEIHLVQSSHTKEVSKVVDLNQNMASEEISLENNKIVITEVVIDSSGTYVTIESDEHFNFNDLNLMAEGKTVPLADINKIDYTKDANNGSLKYTRTFFFESTAKENIQLQINQITTKKTTNKIINVPVK
ncbi:DUF4179 domain-containing protein [Alkalicella caledoniensis]|uniref:DUF4179 domain-containing protein n=1 Tax=Alkalicella caledoniensis TaxID=2731377 RepID=A0A7G9WBA6_ALKCA|nr:DUF4179 domain-containing protein [Alkalicella caledoniensis]QNO15968.1 DUF4179 domain-containing protein [Alkalicella caledoniensis]